MKKLLFTFIALSCGYLSQSQELGLRFGDVTGGNIGIDGVFSTSEFSRVHGTVSFGGNNLGIDLLWDFAYRDLGDTPLNWYAGVGPSFLLGDPLVVSAMGELGLEYRFRDAPISLSGDWRPTVTLVPTTNAFYGSYGLNLRYIF